MSDVTQASLDPALEQFIRREIAKQYNRSSVTTDLIRKTPGNGKNVAWDISVGTATGQVFDDGQDVSTFNSDTEVLAVLQWAEYGDAFKITGRVEDIAQFSQTQLGQTFFYKMNEARERAAEKFNRDLWSGDGTAAPQKLFGLTASGGPLDSTGSYGGQSRSTYPQWQGIKMGNGGIARSITLDTIEYGLEQSFTASGKNPTFGVTTPNVWRLLCGLVDDDKRVNYDGLEIRGMPMTTKMGYHFVEVNGIPVFRDVSVPKGNLVFFHEPSFEIEFLPPAPSRVQRGTIIATAPLAGTPQEQLMVGAPVAGPLVASIIALSRGGNYDRWQLTATGQLKNERPNASLWIADIRARTET